MRQEIITYSDRMMIDQSTTFCVAVLREVSELRSALSNADVQAARYELVRALLDAAPVAEPIQASAGPDSDCAECGGAYRHKQGCSMLRKAGAEQVATLGRIQKRFAGRNRPATSDFDIPAQNDSIQASTGPAGSSINTPEFLAMVNELAENYRGKMTTSELEEYLELVAYINAWAAQQAKESIENLEVYVRAAPEFPEVES